jgi:hypothetical protein
MPHGTSKDPRRLLTRRHCVGAAVISACVPAFIPKQKKPRHARVLDIDPDGKSAEIVFVEQHGEWSLQNT